MLTSLFARLGFTRDSSAWLYAKFIGAAALIVANVANLSSWASYVGITLSETNVHQISVAASIILYFGGYYGNSPLIGQKKA